MMMIGLLALCLPVLGAAGTAETNQKLWDGAKWGDVKMVSDALAAGAVIDTKESEFEQTPLHFAAKAGQLEVAQFLVDNGADVNARTHHDETPLMEAVDHGHDAVAELLLKNKADVNAVTVSGKTALHGAAATGRDKLVRSLVAAGADVKIAAHGGMRPYDIMSRSLSSEAKESLKYRNDL